MGNTSGVMFDGQHPDLAEFVAKAQAQCDRAFPGVFTVEHQHEGDTTEPAVIFHVGKEVFMVWFVGWHNEGLVGGNSPRIGDFGYWVADVLMKRIAEATGGQAFCDAIGPLTQPICQTYYKALDRTPSGAVKWLARFMRDSSYRDWIPGPLRPWFDDPKKEIGA